MKHHKKKFKPPHRVQVPELLKLAEEHRKEGRVNEAIRILLRAEEEAGRKISSVGERTPLGSSPPGQAHSHISQLLAHLFFQRGLNAIEPNRMVSDLEKAVERVPSEPRYLLALGLCYQTLGKPEQAFDYIQRARQISHTDPLVARGLALCRLALGHTREVKEWFRQLPSGKSDTPLKRLAAIRDLMVGNYSQASGHLDGLMTYKEVTAQDLSSERPRQILNGRFWTHLMTGLRCVAAGDLERAETQLSALPPCDRNPSRLDAAVLSTQLFYSGALHCQSGNFQKAALDLQEAERLAREHAWPLPWLSRLAAYFHKISVGAAREGNLPLAIDCWQSVLGIDPVDRAATANLLVAQRIQANQAWHNGQLQQAVALWKKSLQSSPQDEQLLKNTALGCEKLGNAAEAITFWRSLAQRWRQQLRNGQKGVATLEAQLRERLLRLEQHLVGLMTQTNRSAHEILAELEAALRIDPKNCDLHRKYAEMFMEIGRPQQTLKHLNIIERNEGESADLVTQKGMAFEMMRRWSEARKCYERALEIDRSHSVALRSYLLLLGDNAGEAEGRGDLDRAMEVCRQQLSLDPAYLPAQEHLAFLHYKAGGIRETKRAIARVVETDPKSAERRARAGSLYLELGFKQDAEREFQQAVDIDPSNYCYFYIGRSYLRYGKPKMAFKYFGLASSTASFDILMDISDALNHAGYAREAEQYLDLALHKDPGNAEAHLIKALLWMGRMNEEEALREVTEAERLASVRKEFSELLDEARSMKRTIQDVIELRKLVEGTNSASLGMPVMSPGVKRLIAKFGRG